MLTEVLAIPLPRLPNQTNRPSAAQAQMKIKILEKVMSFDLSLHIR